tara:strand:+ start:11126 stop:11764 length:639 start_codon:yes stop_codon:yes gene_type:complete
MPAETNFKDRILALSPSNDEVTDQLPRYVIDGCYDVINRIKGKDPQYLFKFTQKSAEISGATTALASTGIRELIIVESSEIVCKEVSPAIKDKITSSSSIHYASAKDPVYYILDGSLTIAPTPTSAYYHYIPEYDSDTVNAGATVIGIVGTVGTQAFPTEYYEHLVVYAAIKNTEAMINQYLEDDEDIELVNAAQANLASLKQRYESMFGGT